jgi:hypothetical protein
MAHQAGKSVGPDVARKYYSFLAIVYVQTISLELDLPF